MLKEASEERDIGDFKDAIQILSKAAPDYTFPRLEKEFRKRGYNIFLIAMVRLFSRPRYLTWYGMLTSTVGEGPR